MCAEFPIARGAQPNRARAAMIKSRVRLKTQVKEKNDVKKRIFYRTRARSSQQKARAREERRTTSARSQGHQHVSRAGWRALRAAAK